MPTQLSISEIIEIGKVSTYFSVNESSINQLFGKNVIKPVPPVLIPMVTDALEWASDGSLLDSQNLRGLANYALWCYGSFGRQAQNVISGPGGGSVVPIPPGQVPNPLDFIVSGSSFIAIGESSVIITDFIGYNVDFYRNSAPQYTTNPGDGSTYYNWNKVTGQFTLLNGAAFDGERFRISPTL